MMPANVQVFAAEPTGAGQPLIAPNDCPIPERSNAEIQGHLANLEPLIALGQRLNAARGRELEGVDPLAGYHVQLPRYAGAAAAMIAEPPRDDPSAPVYGVLRGTDPPIDGKGLRQRWRAVRRFAADAWLDVDGRRLETPWGIARRGVWDYAKGMIDPLVSHLQYLSTGWGDNPRPINILGHSLAGPTAARLRLELGDDWPGTSYMVGAAPVCHRDGELATAMGRADIVEVELLGDPVAALDDMLWRWRRPDVPLLGLVPGSAPITDPAAWRDHPDLPRGAWQWLRRLGKSHPLDAYGRAVARLT